MTELLAEHPEFSWGKNLHHAAMFVPLGGST